MNTCVWSLCDKLTHWDPTYQYWKFLKENALDILPETHSELLLEVHHGQTFNHLLEADDKRYQEELKEQTATTKERKRHIQKKRVFDYFNWT